MKQVMIQQGKVSVEEVPAPIAATGTVLVQTDHSCISVGTELSGIRSSGTPLWKKALKQPEKIAKAYEMVKAQGLSQTISTVQSKFSSPQPIGYSAAGTVIAVGEGIHDIKIGDRVACAGAQCAFHAEVLSVPRNLVVPVPENLGFAEASTVTLGAIALQGVRRAEPTMGEVFVVVGLGVLGQITAQLLRANGCRVIGIDPQEDRIALALSLGMDFSVDRYTAKEEELVMRLTSGFGADGVIITASAESDEIISTAFKMCRKKGRVILVGDVGLDIKRADIYEKELDFKVSTSYGPGRYDRRYEEEGLDYPISYVRWTENRNMGEYLKLASEGRLQLAPLATSVYPIEKAPEAYAALNDSRKPLVTLLSYPRAQGSLAPKISYSRAPATEGKIRVALVGAGAFAKGVHLPNLKSLESEFSLEGVMSRTGHNATASAKQFGARYATTDISEILGDPSIQAVVVCTRHDQHASQALAALEAGKHVLLEKPTALNEEELAGIEAFFQRKRESAPILLTGYNRRYSPYAKQIAAMLAGRTGPAILNYRMNAGYLPPSHWVHGPEGGGRNIGEACHIYDLFTFLLQAKSTSVSAKSATPAGGHYSPRDNFVATIGFEDGSVANLVYTAFGSSSYPKEHLEVFVDGKTAVMEDYRELSFHGTKLPGLHTKSQEKGQKEELAAFAAAIRKGGAWPNPLWQQLQASRISFEVEKQLGL